MGKVVFKMMYNDYDWVLAHKMLGDGVYFASQGLKVRSGGWGSGEEW